MENSPTTYRTPLLFHCTLQLNVFLIITPWIRMAASRIPTNYQLFTLQNNEHLFERPFYLHFGPPPAFMTHPTPLPDDFEMPTKSLRSNQTTSTTPHGTDSLSLQATLSSIQSKLNHTTHHSLQAKLTSPSEQTWNYNSVFVRNSHSLKRLTRQLSDTERVESIDQKKSNRDI